ncbi:MAG: hypothetical protein RDV41_14630, partial [Planctomycetota bacterium]|nr:hypothetical protein [Planctomycetota bacterium]
SAGLLFEIVLTRIFSATIWYHFTFIAVSVALFGWGMGGLFVELAHLSKWKRLGAAMLPLCSGLFGVSLLAFLLLFVSAPCEPQKLGLYFAMALVPFLLAGMSLSLAFDSYAADANRLYFADLLGAAIGTLLVPCLLGILGAETTVLATAVLPALACFLFLLSGKPPAALWPRLVSLLLVVGLTVFAALNLSNGFVRIGRAPTKALYNVLDEDPARAIVFDRWNAYSRISAVGGFKDSRLARMFIDSDAWTDVSKWDGKYESTVPLKNQFRFVPFLFHEKPRVLVIGPGGGPDVLLAIAAQSSRITAVEMNPLVIEYVKSCGAQAGNIYDYPGVELVQEEGRNFMSRSHEKFDMIILGFVDSWASVASGGLSLTENYLYTSEAFTGYYDHLSETGTLVIIRWPVDVPRCVANTFNILSARGLKPAEIGSRVLAVAEWAPHKEEPVQTFFMLRKSAFPEGLAERLLKPYPDCHRIHVPGLASISPYAELFSGQVGLAGFEDRLTSKANPVTDDMPFYFAREKPYGMPAFMTKLLSIPLGLAAAAMVVVIMLAISRKANRVHAFSSIVYFSMLGIGFILVEIALIHKFILLLGHPIYAICVLLFAMLLWCSIGSLLSRKVSTERVRRALLVVLPVVAVVLAGTMLAVPFAIEKSMSSAIAVRIAVAVSMLTPIGLLMGMPFPLGVRYVRNIGGSVPLMWGVNGIMSVVGSVAAMVLAVVFGFNCALVVGCLFYLLAILPVIAWKAKV